MMAELRVTKLASEGVSFSVNIGAQDPSASKMPDEDSLRALFGAFRHVWMDEEPASFTKTCQILHRSNLTDEEREVLTKCRELWKDVHRNDPIKIDFNGQAVRPRRLIELYFNSVYFHRDRDKRETREALERAFGPAFGRAMVLQSVNNLMQAAGYVEQIVKNVLVRGMP